MVIKLLDWYKGIKCHIWIHIIKMNIEDQVGGMSYRWGFYVELMKNYVSI